MLYQLARSPHVQTKLRQELLSVPSSTPSLEDLNALPYLDQVVREGLRIHAPVASTMRSAAVDDVIPLSAPIRDRKGRIMSEIQYVSSFPPYFRPRASPSRRSSALNATASASIFSPGTEAVLSSE
jgi:hypothetical protein